MASLRLSPRALAVGRRWSSGAQTSGPRTADHSSKQVKDRIHASELCWVAAEELSLSYVAGNPSI